jgi:4-hydroxybenzoate polyprenyltransferase
MLPLCVDLDGTLVRTDTLHEQLVRLVQSRPLLALATPLWLLGGRASFKARLSQVCTLDPALLPYQEDLVTYLRKEKDKGRRLILATASDGESARAVAEHLQLFDEVYASDGRHNLKGADKARLLVEKLGERGFSYAGDSKADIKVWERAGGAVLVGTTGSVRRKVESLGTPAEALIGERPKRLPKLIKAMRIYQWIKNILVFVTMLLAHRITAEAGINAMLMFVAFCATASGIYLINDLFDLNADRAHSRKGKRPFASGELPLAYGLFGPVLVVFGLVVALTINHGSLTVLMLYIVATTAYSVKLKTLPLIDVFLLAGLYTIRLYSGGVATAAPISAWLLAFSSFFFLSLAFLKRFAELSSSVTEETTENLRRGYNLKDQQVIQAMGVASAFMASLVLSLYVDTNIAREFYAMPEALWLIVPLFLFWQCRMWLSSARGNMTDDPIVFAVKDWVSWVTATLGGIVFFLATVGVPGI